MNQVACPQCGHFNRAGAKFCANCRSQLAVSSQTPPVSSAAPDNLSTAPFQAAPVSSPKSNRWLWAAIGVVLLLIIAAVIILLWPPVAEDTVVADATTPAEMEAEVVEDTETADALPTPISEPTQPAMEDTPVSMPQEDPEDAPVDLEPSPNLLTNGNFDQNWDVGWQRSIGPEASGPQRTEVVDMEQSLTGRGLQIERSGPDTLQLAQTVTVNPANLHFRAELFLIGSIDEASNNAEGLGVLMLIYHDVDFVSLGYSIWTNGPQRSSPLFGVEPLPPVGNNVSRRWLGSDWQGIDINLRQEIINSLPTVNPDAVNAVTVMLLAIGNDNCMPDDCLVTIRAADMVLISD